MRKIRNWIKKIVAFDSDVSLKSTSKFLFGDNFSISQDGNNTVLDNKDARLILSAVNQELRIGDPEEEGGGCFLTVSNFGQLDIVISPTRYTIVYNLPTSDPSTSGALWNDSGTVKVSGG